MDNKINVSYHKTKIGELVIASYGGKICIVDFRYRRMRSTVDNRIKKALKVEFIEREDDVIRKTKREIDEYLDGKRKDFDIPIITIGTDFQKQVWSALMEIPYGKTVSYLDIAKSINNPKAVRAIGSANGANALALIIPCHRVIENNGGLGGYGGGLAVKKRLLKIEMENS